MSRNPGKKTCPKCGGSGSRKITHGLCMGKGCNDCGWSGNTWITCDRCNGQGEID